MKWMGRALMGSQWAQLRRNHREQLKRVRLPRSKKALQRLAKVEWILKMMTKKTWTKILMMVVQATC